MLLDYKIASIIEQQPGVKMKILDRYIKGLNLYGKQDAVLGTYFDMLVTAISVIGLGDNFKLELYKKITSLFRDNSILITTSSAPAVPPGTGLAFYYGSGSYDITVEEIQTLLTRDISFKANKSYKFSPDIQVFIFAYPESYGMLDKILDQNQFDTTPGWDVTLEIFTIDGAPVDYYVWKFRNVTKQLNFINSFIFTST